MMDIDKMTDEELLASAPPEIDDIDEHQNESEEPEDKSEDDDIKTDISGEQENNDESEDDSSGSEDEDVENKEETSSGSEETKEESKEEETKENNEEEKVEEEKPEEPDYKAFYEALHAPIKANGKDLSIRSTEEAIKLMQMGANYTQKMQTIAPYRKKIQMLKNAGLLEDDRLNHLIDIASGDKAAISKLLKEKSIDNLDLSDEDASKYIPGNHSVSDEEVRFNTILEDLNSTPEGSKTIDFVRTLDSTSLDRFWKDPSMMSTLHQQRQSGVFKAITDEMEHQKILGNIPEGTPFLDAYKTVGDYLLQQQQQRVKNLPKGTLKSGTSTPARKANVAKVAPTGRNKTPAHSVVDPFSLSDEEFEKQFKNYI